MSSARQARSASAVAAQTIQPARPAANRAAQKKRPARPRAACLRAQIRHMATSNFIEPRESPRPAPWTGALAPRPSAPARTPRTGRNDPEQSAGRTPAAIGFGPGARMKARRSGSRSSRAGSDPSNPTMQYGMSETGCFAPTISLLTSAEPIASANPPARPHSAPASVQYRTGLGPRPMIFSAWRRRTGE